MAGIPGIPERATQRPDYVNQTADDAKLKGLNEKSAELIRDVSNLIGVALRVSSNPIADWTKETGTPTGATGIPSIDNPDDAKAALVNLEKLVAYLKLHNDEKQSQLAKDRIEVNKKTLEKAHADRMEKLNKSLAEMDKAARASLLTKIFGWMMAALAVAFAVASCIATGGLAVGAVIGAVMAVGFCVANECGAMEKLTEGFADLLKEAGMSERAAQITATILITAATIALTIAGGAIGNSIANLVRKAMETTAKAVMTATQVTANAVKLGLEASMTALGLISGAAGINAAVQQYNAGTAKADVSEMEKFLALMRQRLDESQEELEQILQQIQNAIAVVVEIISSATDVESEIANNIGSNATI